VSQPQSSGRPRPHANTTPHTPKCEEPDKAWVKEELKRLGYSSVKQVFLGELVSGHLEVIPYPKVTRAKS